MTVRVLLADDSRVFMSAVADQLGLAGDIQIVGQALDGASAVEQARAQRPDVALIDVEMPGGGATLARRLLQAHPPVRVMCLTGRDDEQTVLAMVSAGATAYVVKGSLDEELTTWVRRCAAGGTFVVAGCADQVRDRVAALHLSRQAGPDGPAAPG